MNSVNSIEVYPYVEGMRNDWNSLVDESRNGTFLHKREFIEYHGDRYEDISLVFKKRNRIVGLLPACRETVNSVRSHLGLTYGGLITDKSQQYRHIEEMLYQARKYYRGLGFSVLYYSAVPRFYCRYPADEDLYALTAMGARLIRRDLNAVAQGGISEQIDRKKRNKLKKALKNRLRIEVSPEIGKVYQLIEDSLMKFDKKPVHSAEELRRLITLFPDNIKCYAVMSGESYIASAVVFAWRDILHMQYIASSIIGRECCAVEYLLYEIDRFHQGELSISFGISTTEQGTELNRTLHHMKEQYGGRAIVHDHYLLDL